MIAIRKAVKEGPIPLRVLRDVRVEGHLGLVRLKQRLSPQKRARERELRKMTCIWLHYGAGPRILPGWINIDGWASPGTDLVVDLRRSLPLSDGSCDLIFTEHVFEHIERPSRLHVLREFLRVLAPEGVLRIVVPDLDLFVNAYLREDLDWFERAGIGGETAAEGMNNIISLHTHRFIDDWTSLQRLLREAGFSRVERSTLNASDIPELRIDREEESRSISSLYVEARR